MREICVGGEEFGQGEPELREGRERILEVGRVLFGDVDGLEEELLEGVYK